MADFLANIVEHVRAVVENRQKQTPLAALHERPLYHQPTRGFARSLNGPTRRIIAEIKRSSPSKGLIRADFSPVVIARDYADHGASAISVLTEERFFQGSLTYLEEIKAAVKVPLLRKDFIIDPLPGDRGTKLWRRRSLADCRIAGAITSARTAGNRRLLYRSTPWSKFTMRKSWSKRCRRARK